MITTPVPLGNLPAGAAFRHLGSFGSGVVYHVGAPTPPCHVKVGGVQYPADMLVEPLTASEAQVALAQAIAGYQAACQAEDRAKATVLTAIRAAMEAKHAYEAAPSDANWLRRIATYRDQARWGDAQVAHAATLHASDRALYHRLIAERAALVASAESTVTT